MSVQYPVPEDMDVDVLRRFFDNWCERADGRPACRKIDFDPADVVEMLGYINMVQVEREWPQPRFKVTVWGTLVADLYGGDFTGRYVDEIMSPTKQGTVQDAFLGIITTVKPHFWQVPVPRPYREFRSYRRLALPLLDDDGEIVSHIVALIVPDSSLMEWVPGGQTMAPTPENPIG